MTGKGNRGVKMTELDITVGHRPTRCEATELWRDCASTLVGLGVTDLYAVDLIPPSRGHRGFEVRLVALFEGAVLTESG